MEAESIRGRAALLPGSAALAIRESIPIGYLPGFLFGRVCAYDAAEARKSRTNYELGRMAYSHRERSAARVTSGAASKTCE